MSPRQGISSRAYQANRTGLGIAAILSGSFVLTTLDALMKGLTQHYPVVQAQFLRSLIITLCLTGYYIARRQPVLQLRPGWQIILPRSLLSLVMSYLFFYSLQFINLAAATTLLFTYPVFVTLLSRPILGEPVNGWRWGAIALGFLGVGWMMQPGSSLFQPAAALTLSSAVLLAVFLITLRFIPPGTSTVWVTYCAAWVSLLGISPFALWFWAPVQWSQHYWLILGVGLVGFIGGFLMNTAFRYAPAAVVAALDYAGILWATMYSIWVFKEEPPATLFPGMALIISAGALIAWRESVAHRDAIKPKTTALP